MSAMIVPEAASAPNLKVRGLAVRRGERLLFEALDFDVEPGGVLLLRGPNGVGKSTLLLALAGIVRPDAGSIAHEEQGAPHFLSYQSGMKARLTVRENLEFWRAVNGPTGMSPQHALLEVGLGGLDALEAGYLSSGQTRRLSLARLLVSNRALWLLDEPSATLDADGELLLGRLLDRHRERGGLAVIATHHDLPLARSAGVATLMLGSPA